MADARKDLYEVLGVSRDVDSDALRKAYRKLARQYHPDVNPGDEAAEARFKEISEAYSVLSDDEKRRNYDEFGEVSLEGGFDPEAARRAREAFGDRFGRQGRGGFTPPGGESFEFRDLEDILGRVFTSRGGATPGTGGLRMRGADLEAALEFDFMDAMRGGERRLSFMRPNLSGSHDSVNVTVRVPPGIADGGRIRIPGKGAPGVGGGPPGDLWARVRVTAHRVFRREGRDLHIDLPISVVEAVRGAQVEIPTLDGRATVTIPAGTDSGTKLRLRGKGVPDPAGGTPGDLYATVQIRVPRDLDEAATEKLEALDAFQPPDLRKELFE